MDASNIVGRPIMMVDTTLGAPMEPARDSTNRPSAVEVRGPDDLQGLLDLQRPASAPTAPSSPACESWQKMVFHQGCAKRSTSRASSRSESARTAPPPGRRKEESPFSARAPSPSPAAPRHPPSTPLRKFRLSMRHLLREGI